MLDMSLGPQIAAEIVALARFPDRGHRSKLTHCSKMLPRIAFSVRLRSTTATDARRLAGSVLKIQHVTGVWL
jgi:hypothetical protein